MAGSKKKVKDLRQDLAGCLHLARALAARIVELETKLKYNSAHYSEGGSGEYVNNEEAMNRFEGKT